MFIDLPLLKWVCEHTLLLGVCPDNAGS